MKAKRIDPKPKKKTPTEEAEAQLEKDIKSGKVNSTQAAKIRAAREASKAAANIRDNAVKSGNDYQGVDSKGNPIKPAGGYASVPNTLGGDGPMMDTGRGVKGGTASMVRKAKRRVARSAASPQAKRAARRIYSARRIY
jgi:hypothetical protein